jgi:hypothetical protein
MPTTTVVNDKTFIFDVMELVTKKGEAKKKNVKKKFGS